MKKAPGAGIAAELRGIFPLDKEENGEQTKTPPGGGGRRLAGGRMAGLLPGGVEHQPADPQQAVVAR
jgi:hypothetical protein